MRLSTLRPAGVLLPVVLALAACAARLEPAPGARLVAGPGRGAVVERDGVRLVARADAWRGYPPYLEGHVTPILVTLDNGGTRPLRVRRESFALVEAGGRRLAARGPFEVEGVVMEPVSALVLGGPSLAPRPWGWHPLALDPWDWDWHQPRLVRIELPSGDMVQKALPEGVVEPGGRVAGFLYFEPLRRRAGPVDLAVDLVDARTGEALGTLTIPFVVE